MTRTALQRLILALLLALPAGCRQQAQEVKEEKPPEFATVRVGFAERYKVGLWTPLEVTLRGGSSRIERCRVRANLPDSDGLNCSFEAPDCQLLPEQEMKVVLYVRFGRESGPLGLQLLEGDKTLAEKTFNSNSSPPEDRFHDALTGPGKHGGGQRLIVSVGKSPLELEKAAAEEEDQETHQPKEPRNVVAKVDGLAGLPTRWEGYEGVDVVIVSTSDPESLFAKITPENARVEALEQWVRMGGKLVLCAGSKAEEVLHATSPLAKFLPGRFDKSVLLRQTSGWESYAKSTNPIPPPKTGEKVEMPTPRLADVQGKIEAREGDLPLVIRKPQGLGQVIFVAADLDRGPIRDWSDRRSLLAAILDLPANGQAGETDNFGPNYGYNDLAGQLRMPWTCPATSTSCRFRGRPAGGRLYPPDRTGRLLPAPPAGARHAVDVDHLSGDRGPLCRGGLPGRLLAQRQPASRQPDRSGRYRHRGHGPRRELVQHLQPSGRVVRPLHATTPARRQAAAGGQRVAGLVRQGGR